MYKELEQKYAGDPVCTSDLNERADCIAPPKVRTNHASGHTGRLSENLHSAGYHSDPGTVSSDSLLCKTATEQILRSKTTPGTTLRPHQPYTREGS